MQHMHGIGDGSGVGDLRPRPHNHQALKCPRCDSLNTKFCYYNNYNLSQPRHFCKSCCRYWTKGGVLRNVPVGGGGRKTKLSKAKTRANSSAEDAHTPTESKLNAQSSSSENSSLPAVAARAEDDSAPSKTTSDMYNFADEKFFEADLRSGHQTMKHPSTDGQIFSTEIGSFTSLMTSSEVMTTFGMADILETSNGCEQPVSHTSVVENPSQATVDEFKIEDMCDEGLAAALDWGDGGGGGGDQGFFDLTAGVEPAYWNQSEWTDNDQSFSYLP